MEKIALGIPGTVNGMPTTIQVNTPYSVNCGPNGDCLSAILGGVVSILFVAAILLSLAYLIWGGLDWTMSGGDKTKLSKARLKLIYAMIGLVLVFLAFFIVNLLSKFLGINLLSIQL